MEPNPRTKFSPTLICNDMSVNLENAGKFISQKEAKTSIQNYFEDANMSQNDPRHIYGFTYGLNTIKKFLERIEKYNSNLSDAQLPIKGIRLYNGKSLRNDPDFPLREGVLYRDVFLIPVLENGKDLYEITLLDDDNIVGQSRPCPNECGLSFFMQ